MSIDELEKECNINEYGDIDENGHYIFKRFREILAQETTKARIDELQHIREFWGQAKDETLSSKPFNFVALSDIDSRVKELQEGKRGNHGP